MKVLLCGGKKTENIKNALEPRFRTGGIEILVEKFIEDVNNIFVRGEYVDRLIVIEPSIRYGEDSDESEVRASIGSLIDTVESRNTAEADYVFVTDNEDLAKIIAEESIEVTNRRRIVMKKPPYDVAFFVKHIVRSLEEFNESDLYVYGAVEEAPEPEEELVWSYEKTEEYDTESITAHELESASEVEIGEIVDNLEDNKIGEDEEEFGFDDSEFDDEEPEDTEEFEEDDLEEDEEFTDTMLDGDEFLESGIEDEIEFEVESSESEEEFKDSVEEDEDIDIADDDWVEGGDEEITEDTLEGDDIEFNDFELEGDDYEVGDTEGDIDPGEFPEDEFDTEEFETGELDAEEFNEDDIPVDGDGMDDFDVDEFEKMEELRDEEEFDDIDGIEDIEDIPEDIEEEPEKTNEFMEMLDGEEEDDSNEDKERLKKILEATEDEVADIVNNGTNEENIDTSTLFGLDVDMTEDEEDEDEIEESYSSNMQGPIVGGTMGYVEDRRNSMSTTIELSTQGVAQENKKRVGLFGKRDKKENRGNHSANISNIGTNNISMNLVEMLSAFKGRGSALAVTGTPGSGKTTIVYNLANIISKMGFTVLIVDFDTVNRGQTYINKNSYEAIHSLNPDNICLKQALNAVSTGISEYASIIKPGFHLLSMGLAGDIATGEKLASKETLNRFASNVRNNYNFIIYDIPFDVAVDYALDIVFTSENIVLTCEASNRGIMEMMVAMCNVENEYAQEVMFARSQLCMTKFMGYKRILGTKVGNTRSVLNRVDKEVQDLLGIDPEYYFSNLRICGEMRFDQRYEDMWFSNNAYSDLADGNSEYTGLLTNILLKR